MERPHPCHRPRGPAEDLPVVGREGRRSLGDRGESVPRGTRRTPTSPNRLAWNGVSPFSFTLRSPGEGKEASRRPSGGRGRVGNIEPGERKEKMRELERRGVTERLSSTRLCTGQLGNKERAHGAEAPAGNEARPAGRPGVGFSVSAADERAAFQLRASRAAFLATRRAASRRGRGLQKGYICTKCLRSGPQGLQGGGGRVACEPGRGERKGGGGPRCLGNGNIPLGAAHRTIRLPAVAYTTASHGERPWFLRPSPCTHAVHPGWSALGCTPQRLQAARAF